MTIYSEEDKYEINLKNLKYRVCVINDFRNERHAIDCRKFGVLLVTDAWRVSSKHRGFQIHEDSIGIFINFEMVLETKDKELAKRFLKNLIKKVPEEFKKEYEQFKEYLEIR